MSLLLRAAVVPAIALCCACAPTSAGSSDASSTGQVDVGGTTGDDGAAASGEPTADDASESPDESASPDSTSAETDPGDSPTGSGGATCTATQLGKAKEALAALTSGEGLPDGTTAPPECLIVDATVSWFYEAQVGRGPGDEGHYVTVEAQGGGEITSNGTTLCSQDRQATGVVNVRTEWAGDDQAEFWITPTQRPPLHWCKGKDPDQFWDAMNLASLLTDGALHGFVSVAPGSYKVLSLMEINDSQLRRTSNGGLQWQGAADEVVKVDLLLKVSYRVAEPTS